MKVKLLVPSAVVPVRKHHDDSGLDLAAAHSYRIGPGETDIISTGIAVELPDENTGMVCPRSSISKSGILVHLGTLDAGYRGEIFLFVTNLTQKDFFITVGDRLAQLVVVPVRYPKVELVDELPESNRGTNGLGSTGAQ